MYENDSYADTVLGPRYNVDSLVRGHSDAPNRSMASNTDNHSSYVLHFTPVYGLNLTFMVVY